MLDSIWQWLRDVILAWGYPGVVGLMALESSFVPFPSEIVIPPAGANARAGTMSLPIVIAAGIVGSILGALLNYWLAYRFGRPFLLKHGRYLLLPEKKLLKVEAFFRRHGEIGTFVGRLVPVVRQYISFPAGLAGMPLGRFCFFTALGSGIWVTVLALIGYTVGPDLELVKRHSGTVLLYMAPVLVLIVAFYIWWNRRRRVEPPLSLPPADAPPAPAAADAPEKRA